MNLKAIISSLWYEISHFLYPRFCFDCKGKVKKGEEFCSLCSGFLDEEILPENVTFENGVIEKMYTCFHFENEVVRNSVHAIKYRFYPGPILELLKKRLPLIVIEQYDFVVPVPLHWRRKNWRGYNQAELLGRVVANHLTCNLINPLIRKRYTKTQTKRKKWQRKGAMKSVFALNKKNNVQLEGKTVLLVDDVATTGATAKECAALLQKAGVKSIALLTFARA